MLTLTLGFTAQQIIDEGRITWKDIDLLKTWLDTQNFPKLTDEQIVLFLLSCSNEQEPTKSTIIAHYSIKNRCPEIFENRDIQRADVQKQLNTSEICLFPERTDDGYSVGLIRLYDTHFKNYKQVPIMKLIYMTLDALVYENPPKGFIVLIDLKGAAIGHLTRARLGTMKPFFQYLQEGLPARLKKIHVLNTVYFIDKLMVIVKPFMKKEVLDKVTFHPTDMNMELFYEKCVPKRCLPEDYGGDLPSVRIFHQQHIERLTNLENYFKTEELQRRSVN